MFRKFSRITTKYRAVELAYSYGKYCKGGIHD